MNGTASHLTTGVISWIEHEEAMVFRLVKKIQVNFDRIIVPVLGIGLAIWVVSLFLSVFARYSECAEMIALCSR
jgi:hypothetical protein